jgi:Brp/Blh family beta-carotene 15,15'-monooxygenase
LTEWSLGKRGSSAFTGTANRTVLNIGLVAVIVAVPLSILARSTTVSTGTPDWLIAVAIVALAIGIPHGAVDYLTFATLIPRHRALVVGAAYLGLAIAATVAVLTAPGPAFIIVLAMTVWHFGTGDVEASHELDGTPQETGVTRVIHAIAAGSAPVLLPLTSPAAVSTLMEIQPRLAELFTPALISSVRIAVFTIIVVALVMLIKQGRLRAALELVALTVLGYVVAPLLAFAIYFSFWHSLRHTARLSLHAYGSVSARSIGRTFLHGVPALVGTILVVGLLAALTPSVAISATWLWIGLALVWGLTVPHMAFVALFDRQQHRNAPSAPGTPLRQGHAEPTV